MNNNNPTLLEQKIKRFIEDENREYDKDFIDYLEEKGEDKDFIIGLREIEKSMDKPMVSEELRMLGKKLKDLKMEKLKVEADGETKLAEIKRKHKANMEALDLCAKLTGLATDLNNELQQKIEAKSNIPEHSRTSLHTWIQICYLGAYIFLQRKTSSLSEENRIEFSKMFKNHYLDYVTHLHKNDDERLKERLKVDKWFDENIKLYSDYRGDISLLLKDKLTEFFNGLDGKVKFFNKPKKLLFKIFFLLGVSDKNGKFQNKHVDDFFLPEDALLSITTEITKKFRQEDITFHEMTND